MNVVFIFSWRASARWREPGPPGLERVTSFTKNMNVVFIFSWRASARWREPGPPGLER